MIRTKIASSLLDYLAFTPSHRGKYRLAQAASKLLDGVPIKSAYGPRLHTRFSDSTFWLAARFGNDGVMNHLADLSSQDGFIDVGANIGLTTCFAAERCSAVLSLEPSPRELAELLRNCTLLNPMIRRPVCVGIAASDETGFASFRLNKEEHSGGNSLGDPVKTSDIQVTVPTACLDDLVNQSALIGWDAMHTAWKKSTLVVKIDVEGFESGVVKGMTQLLSEKRCRKVIVELNQSRANKLKNDADVDQIMRRFGYTPSTDPGVREHYDQCYSPAT